MGVVVKVDGLDKTLKKFKEIPLKAKTELDAGLHELSEEYQNKVIAAAPVFDSGLKQGITVEHKELNHEVISHAPYSAYVEFGTKSRAKIPADLSVYASQFKGKGSGGGVADLFKAILEWVKKKGIASRWSLKTQKPIKATKDDNVRILEAASAITISILRHGIHAQPFFFPHLPWAQSEVQKIKQKVVKQALK